MKSLSLAGIFPPIPTPFDAEGAVAHDRLAENIAWWCATSVAGLVVLGTNGEFAYLNDQEKLDVFRTARAAIPRDRLFIAGTGCESTRSTLQLTEQAAVVGADMVVVITPNYFKSRMDAAAMRRHYLQVAEHSPVPVTIYNMPANTGVDMPAETVIELAQHPNIVGIKDSSGNLAKLGEIIHAAPPHFQVLAGSASFLYAAMLLGAVGGVAALANIAPELCCQLYDLIKAGHHEPARQLQFKLIAPNTAVTSRWGVPAIKQALDWLGHYGGLPRSPLGPLDAAQQASLRAILTAAEIL